MVIRDGLHAGMCILVDLPLQLIDFLLGDRMLKTGALLRCNDGWHAHKQNGKSKRKKRSHEFLSSQFDNPERYLAGLSIWVRSASASLCFPTFCSVVARSNARRSDGC